MCNGSKTSIPAGRNAQIAATPRGLAKRVKTSRPYVRRVKQLAVRPAACPIRGLRRIGWRRASDMGTDLMHDTLFVGMDVHKATISVAVAGGACGGEVLQLGNFLNRAGHVGKLVERLSKTGGQRLRFCYEAGPCGYGLHLQITALGHECVVVAPSLIPMKAGDRIKTDRRDAVTLAKLHRAGELTAVWVPDAAHEAMRDLIRARATAVGVLGKARQHLQGFHRHARRQNRSKLRRLHPSRRSRHQSR
jgi:transposase